MENYKFLLDKVISYFLLINEIKGNNNIVKEIKLLFKRIRLRSQIISLVDSSTLSFKELYKLLKLYEYMENRKIQFKTCFVINEDEEFEEKSAIPCILVRKVGNNLHKEKRYFLVDSIYEGKIAIKSASTIQHINPYIINNVDIQLFFRQLKRYFRNDYEKFTDFVMSYLIHKYL